MNFNIIGNDYGIADAMGLSYQNEKSKELEKRIKELEDLPSKKICLDILESFNNYSKEVRDKMQNMRLAILNIEVFIKNNLSEEQKEEYKKLIKENFELLDYKNE